jgi:formylglycine-generating enzyme required for sulfatase activity
MATGGERGGRLVGRLVSRIGVFAAAIVAAALVARGEESRLPGDTFRDCVDCTELVIVPNGDFTMGSNDKPAEAPARHIVIRKAFAIGRREISFAEWGRCVEAGVCKYVARDQGQSRDDLPVTNVSWNDAQDFASWISKVTGKTYRLPSEAEWEYAARAGSTTSYWWGNDVGKGHARCADCGGAISQGAAPVGFFRPNAFGLYDTSGNAAEWVLDCWNANFKGAPADGSAWTSGDCSLRVLRGGSFADKSAAVRSSSRFRYDIDVRYYANGFRLVRELN